MGNKQSKPVRDALVYDVSDMPLDNLTEEIEKTLSQCISPEPETAPVAKPTPKGARWALWT